MKKLIFSVPYQRPKQLTDPYLDFIEDKDLLDAILMTKDENLNFLHFSCLFHPILPAGRYEETVYFLPWALRFIIKKGDGATDIMYNIIIWAEMNKKMLIKDSVYAKIINFIKFFFNTSFKSFNLIRNGGHCLYPENGAFIFSILNASLKNKTLHVFVSNWIKNSFYYFAKNYSFAAWQIWLINESYRYQDYPYKSMFQSCLYNQELKDNACNIVIEEVLKTDNNILLDYWDKELHLVI
jgi:hypothetical protein